MNLEVGYGGRVGLGLLIVIWLLELFFKNSIIANELLTNISRFFVLSRFFFFFFAAIGCGEVYEFTCIWFCVCLFSEPKPEHNYRSDWLKTTLWKKSETQADVLKANYPSRSNWKYTRTQNLSGNAVEMLLCIIFKCPCVMTFTAWNGHFVL